VESHEWNLFDDEMLAQFSGDKFVSPSRENEVATDGHNSSSDVPEGKAYAWQARIYGWLMHVSREGETNVGDEPDESSVFAVGMPGAMKVEEVQQLLSLKDVKIRFRHGIFSLNVRVS
jgi:hypothetical protein